jgi:peptide/nickel transport system ATP-binding protein
MSVTPDRPPLLEARGLAKRFPIRGGLTNRVRATVQAVDDVSFSVAGGEVLGIVGESGCGKSTTGRLLMHLITPDAGEIAVDGIPVEPGRLAVRKLRRQVQMVFQDSYSSLNPRMTIVDAIALAPRIHGLTRAAARRRARDLLDRVGLTARLFAERYPHELSGGQRQRVNIARALALEPRLLVLDESVSALDKSVEAQILMLLQSLKEEFDLTYVFISHELNVVEYISDRILVMYLGRVVESGPVGVVYADPRHPYTRALFASKTSLDPRKRISEAPISGEPPNPIDPPSGCSFRTRCDFAEAVCAARRPEAAPTAAGSEHRVACFMNEPGSGHSRAIR